MDEYTVNGLWPEWKVVRRIGSGTFGTVYEIERNNFGFTEKSALKVISVPKDVDQYRAIESMMSGSDETTEYISQMKDSFLREIASMTALKKSPYIVRFEEYRLVPKEDIPGWDILIRMDMMDTDLASYIRNNTLTREEILRIGIDICLALEDCAEYNIIHRDIKPSNIFRDGKGRYLLGDFGESKVLESTLSVMTQRGTPSFMAPEVAKGLKYGSPADIYSLGIVLYRLFNFNRDPFLPAYPDPIMMSDRDSATLRRLKGEKPLPPVSADDRTAEAILKAIEPDAKDRYASAKDFRLALEKCLVPSGEDASVNTASDGPEAADFSDDFTASKDLSAGESTAGSDGSADDEPTADPDMNKAECTGDTGKAVTALTGDSEDTYTGFEDVISVEQVLSGQKGRNISLLTGWTGIVFSGCWLDLNSTINPYFDAWDIPMYFFHTFIPARLILLVILTFIMTRRTCGRDTLAECAVMIVFGILLWSPMMLISGIISLVNYLKYRSGVRKGGML